MSSALVPSPSGARSQTALDLVYEYVFGRPELARCGVLVGRSAPDGLPSVAAMVPLGDTVPPERATLGPDEWQFALASLAAYYPALEIVGWFVSRPGGRARADRAQQAAHRRYMGAPGQILLSFDTAARTAAVFALDTDSRFRCVHRDIVTPRALSGTLAHLDVPTVRREPWPVAGPLALFAAGLAGGLALWLAQHGGPL